MRIPIGVGTGFSKSRDKATLSGTFNIDCKEINSGPGFTLLLDNTGRGR